MTASAPPRHWFLHHDSAFALQVSGQFAEVCALAHQAEVVEVSPNGSGTLLRLHEVNKRALIYTHRREANLAGSKLLQALTLQIRKATSESQPDG